MANVCGAMGPGGSTAPDPMVSQEVLVRGHWDRRRIVELVKASPEGELSTPLIAGALGRTIAQMLHHIYKLKAAGVIEVSRRENRRGRPPTTWWRINPDYLNRVPDGVALDTLADFLREANGSIDVDRVRQIVRETGRCVVEGEAPAPKPSRAAAKFPEAVPSTEQELAEKLERMQVISLERRCQCEGTIADSEGCCASCSKPKLISEAVSA